MPRMELKLEVLLSSSIKRKKPWPRFCWLGKEKEAVFLLDDNRLSEIHLVSGRTKKKTPKLQPLLQKVVTMSASPNGMWLVGLLVSGELFLWNKDKDSLKMVSAIPAVHELASSVRGTVSTVRLSLLVSENGQRVFLGALMGQVFLWECSAPQDLSSPRDITAKGRWSEISHPENAQLPSSKGKEASIHSVFVKNQAVGDVCLSVFVFSTEEQLTITFLKIQWEMIKESKHSSVGFTVHWVSKSYLFGQLVPPCRPVKSRGALVPALSPDGQLLAIVLNQKDPRVTQVLFVSTQNFVTVSSLLGGCGLKAISIPAKYVRSYWVGSVSWTPEGLYLVCVLKRGSLLMLARLGGLVSLSTTGCKVEFGPAHFLPLHPLVTYRPPAPLHTQDGSLSSSSASLCDPMRQRYSITCHPRQPLLIVSDGYMVTVLRLPRRPSATAIMSALLLDAAQGLENIRKVMGSSSRVEPQLRSRLESMSTLMFTGSLLAFKETEPPLSTLPLYLQETGDTERAQGEEDDDDSEDGLHSRMESEGKLEFASMFDTLHAHTVDPKPTSSAVQEDLTRVYRNILTVWALAVSLGGAVKQRERLLKYTITCVVRLINLLRVSAFISRKNKLNWVTRTHHILRTLLSFLPWDTTRCGGSSCLPVAVELSRRFVEMFLPSSDLVLSSHNFNAALLVLREASHSVNLTYIIQSRTLHYGKDDQVLCSSDLFAVRLLHEDTDINSEITKPTAQDRSLPSNRLVVIWRDVYRRALKYQMMLNNSKGDEGTQPECEKMSIIMPKIQKVLQTAGDRLEESHVLRNFTGEELFILGEYSDSVRVWRAELCAERERGPLTCYLETRYCLALLYGHLFQYHLREAQGLCDRLTRQLQPHTGHQEEMPGLDDDPVFEGWLLGPVGREAALAVVQSLARFMVAYFTNRPLCILPPHSVEVLPALHLPHDAGRRVVELSQSRVVVGLRSQHLSDVWTVDYALELLLLGGLLPEAAWMAQHLGDWKMAATLSLAYSSYCREPFDMSSLRWRELHLPTQLHPAVIFQTQLEMLLGRAVESEGNDNTACVEDVELLQVSVQEILKASVMAEVDVFSQPLKRLLESAKERATSLPVLLPAAFYLPAPPLYCPQPSPDTQETRSACLDLERDSRCQLSGLIQKVLLLLRAAHSSRPTAQWYIRKLHHCRHLLHKIWKKAPEPNVEFIPEGLKKFSSHRGFFQSGSRKDMDGVTVQTIICFRELCALCWMLHARDQLTISCRRYQSVRNQRKDAQTSDVIVADLCIEALGWACRLLPFCRFLNAEEALQDLVLSLVAELPPSHVTAETLARVFPEEEESVRVPLREKYTSLVQRLRPVLVSDTTAAVPSGSHREDVAGESMMILIRGELRRRRRELRRLEKHLAAAEQFLWEREEEAERGGADSILKRLSLGTSLSDSTLTDCGRPLVYSEGDTAETLSETLSPEPQTKTLHGSRTRPTKDSPDRSTHEKKENKRSNSLEPEGTKSTRVEPTCLPTVGTWEFELEDKEYTLFLELFLSYVLEKDSLDAEDSELPLLSSFSKQLHTKELHSVTFDMLTTLKRRQRDGYQTGCNPGARLPLFRAGRCFQTVPVTPEPPLTIGPGSTVQSNAQIASNATPAQALPGVGKQQGLFGHGQQAAQANLIGSKVKGSQSSLPFESWAFKILSPAELDVQVQLDSMLESRFPQLARLLEWMMRWADRRVLLPQPIRIKWEGSSDSVVIRVKATTPAVLFALELLKQRYTAALMATDEHDIGFRRHSPPVHVRKTSPASVQQSITDRRKDRDRSEDTGYPASAGTPAILPDLDAQHTYSHDEVEDVVDQTDSPLSEEEDVISDLQNNITEIRGEIRRSPVAEDDESSIGVATEGSWLSSNQGRAPREAKDQVLTLADLESLHTEELSEDSVLKWELSSYSEHVKAAYVFEKALWACHINPRLSFLTGGEALRSDENHVSCGTLDRDAPVEACRREASNVQQTSHVIPEEGMRQTEGQSFSHRPGSDAPHNRAETQTDPVRQLLQDELFRLVQLQQINFMSLMQVVGASFSNLPLSQHNPLRSNVMLSQTAVTSAPPPCDPRSEPTHGQTQNIRPASCDGPEGPTRVSGEERVNHRRMENRDTVHSTSAVNHRHDGEQRNLPLRPQALEQLTIRPDWPQDGHTDGRSFIPTSHGLLTTAHADAQTPVQRTAPIPPRLRLLQLQPPQPNYPRPQSPPVKEAWGPSPHPASVHINILPSHSRPPWVGASAPPSHLHFDRGRTGGSAEALRFPPAPHRAVPGVGLPLLRFHPDAQRTVTLPRIPQSTTQKPPNVGVAGTGHYPRLQLLRRDPDPPSAMRINTPPVRTPRLIPLEELLRWAAEKQTAIADGKPRLLKTDKIVQNSHTSSPSIKRRKRREEKNKDEKIQVTFRPEESIIPPDEILQPAEESSDQNDGYVIPLGADSELTGQMLLDKMYSTSAELHAYASTQKRPPEIQDACTNTDPEPSRSITDKAVSVQLPSSPIMPSASTGNGGLVGVAPVVPPDVFLNLRFSKEKSPEGTDSNTHNTAEGRRFINVIDLADDSLLQNLPPSQAPNSPPSFAQLHLLAARAVNPAPVPILNSALINTKPIFSTEELPGPVRSSSPPAVDTDDVLGGDPITLSVLSAVKIHSSSLDRVLMSRTQISERLTEMDAQLARLQDIADNIDKEFANTRLLVNTIETQNPVVMPRVERKPYSRHVTTLQEVKNDNPSMMNLAGEEILSSTVWNQSSALGEHSPPAVKQEQRVQDTDGDWTESLFEDPEPRADETLGLTGLSDVKDILSELIRDGALSRSALGLSQREAHKSSRSEVKQGGVMIEEERRDVRIWMRRKQRERLMKYHKEREEKREQEHRPFTSPLTHNPSSVDLATTKRSKEERDKMIQQEHYEQRARDACSLITDLLTTPINLPTKPQERLPQRSSSQSSMRNKKSPKGQTGPYRRSVSSLGKTVVLQRTPTTKPNGSLSNRFGLHRPASALPGDRLSQVTRRGMLTDLKTRQETKTNHQIKDQTRGEDRNPEDSSEVSSILGFKDKENKQGFEEYDEAFQDVDPLRDLVGFDALSDSTGSVLSKLDWAAIEKIVAEEED